MTLDGAASALRPRPASTVALLRPGPGGLEVLLTHRPRTMVFGPGLHVFPGGAVDPEDADPRLVARSARAPDACAAAWAGELGPEVAAAHHVAAVRELYEEAGVLLATARGGGRVAPGVLEEARRAGASLADLVEALDLVLRTDRLVPLSRWVTPPMDVPRRFDARFFVAELPDGACVALDDHEVAAHEWTTPRAALEARADGRIALWQPTSTTLQQLAFVRDLDDVRRRLAPVAATAPPDVDELRPGIVRVRLHGAGGIPGQAVNAYVVGERRLLVVDPGDPNEAAAEAFLGLAAARGAAVVAILLTVPLPDHAAGAVSLALRVGAPVLAARGAVRMLPDAVEALDDGDLIDRGDMPARVHATPGTHPDHLSYELSGAGVVLVGDLEGPGPSRTIPGPVDEVALRASGDRIARLGQVARLPAHGQGPARGQEPAHVQAPTHG